MLLVGCEEVSAFFSAEEVSWARFLQNHWTVRAKAFKRFIL